ncbi:MAG: DUF1501 domain-containing protein, partial [Bacteroidota bacterium]
MTPHQKTRRGTTLHNTKAHAQDHQNWSRRSFLSMLGLAGATSVGLSAFPLTGLRGAPLFDLLANTDTNRKLVLIRLKGGNDGLNTIVPIFDYDRYANFRPTLRHQQTDLIGLDADFAMPTAMADLQSLWAEGQMRVVNSVGYANHSLSHFTGADIMASGDSNLEENGDGWLARFYTSVNPDYRENPPSVPPAIKLGGPTSILFNDADKVDISANFATPEGLEELASTGRRFDDLTAPDNCYHGEQVLFLRSVGNAAYRYSAAIFEAFEAGANGVEYTSSLGEQLKLVAPLIKGGLPTQLYLVTLDGFDTHVGQNGSGNHLGLLEDLSQAINQFYADLALTESDEEVLAMTYSEFGRRVAENGLSGTDHGAALPVMLFGPPLNGAGVHGEKPDLGDLDVTGNLKFGTDFRSLYATILENWFCLAADDVNAVLGGNYDRLPELGFACGTTSTNNQSNVLASGLETRLLTLGGGQYRITFELPQDANLHLELYTMDGRRLQTLLSGYRPAGEQFVDFSLAGTGLELAPL